MGDGSISVAPGSPSTLKVPTTVDIYVRVRDLCGRPLKGAQVTVNGRTPVPTDDGGLALISGSGGASSFKLSAEYTPNMGSTPRRPISSQQREVSINDAFDPSPPDAPDPNARREVHATLFVPVRYALVHLFGWQNPILRNKIYYDAPVVGRHARTSENKEVNRSNLLDYTSALIDKERQQIDVAKKALDASRKALEAEKVQLAAAEKKLAGDTDRLNKNDERVAHLDAPTREKTKVTEEKKRKGLQDTFDKDEAARNQAKDKVDKRLASIDAATKALDAARASHGGTTHRTRLEYLFDKVLPNAKFDPWIKYGIIHLTGLRYRPSNACCFPAEPMVYGMREKEIDEREHPSSSSKTADEYGKAQRVYAREYLALARSNPTMLTSVVTFYPKQRAGIDKGSKRRKFDRTPSQAKGKTTPEQAMLERLERLARSDGAWMASPPDPTAKTKPKPKPPTDLYDLRAIASSFCEAWMKALGAAGAKSFPPDEDELLGEIVDRRFNGNQIPEEVWQRAMRCTQLLHDFIDAGLDTNAATWNTPAVPAEWSRVFPGSSGNSDWLTHHKTTMQPYVRSVVCNDITSILARARGLAVGEQEFMMGMAEDISAAGKAAQAARDKYGGSEDQADPLNSLPAGVRSARPSHESFVGLFRPTRISDLRRGDILFVGNWLKVGADDEPYVIRAQYVVDAGPGAPVSDPEGFSAAIAAGIPEVASADDLVIPPGKKVVYGIERNRTKKNVKGEMVAASDRLVRARIPDPPKPKSGEKPPDPPPAQEPVREAFYWQHVATVVQPESESLLTLETLVTAGLFRRRWADVSNANWWAGRVAPGAAPDLSWFLNRSRLFDPPRLDNG